MLLPAPIAAARSAVYWLLVATPDSPMVYQPLDVMRRVRKNTSPLRTAEAEAVAADIDGAIASLGGSDFARVAVAGLLLGGGGIDECHDLVTPLSWDDGTVFGGPAVPGSPAAREATWAHAIIHRAEGPHPGEFGTGWHNSAFWFGQVIAPDLYEVTRAAVVHAAATSSVDPAAALNWCASSLENGWAPRVLNGLCHDVMAGEASAVKLRSFAEAAATVELLTLIDHCLKRSGYTGFQNGGLEAARAISDAHAGAFAASGRVVLRGVLRSPHIADAVAVAAAVACRLLDVRACRIVHAAALAEDGAPVVAVVPSGGAGDALVVLVESSAEPLPPGSLLFTPCEATNHSASWVDALHGARGVSPSSVLQWSKGTVHTPTE